MRKVWRPLLGIGQAVSSTAREVCFVSRSRDRGLRGWIGLLAHLLKRLQEPMATAKDRQPTTDQRRWGKVPLEVGDARGCLSKVKRSTHLYLYFFLYL